ncbi:hypothetical protein KVP09_16100 [Alcaligenaceae bacterium CGII-47]|nr:hypothetical protein [Alcaligenaceae bacterium CGII-47]
MLTSSHTALLVGGNLCHHIAMQMDPSKWTAYGLRRHPATDSYIRWLAADLLQPATLLHLPADISHVVYAVAPDERTAPAYREIYLTGLNNLLDALPHNFRLERFILVSSTAVWAPSEEEVTEDTPTHPGRFNGKILLEAEAILRERLPDTGVVLRLSGLYGQGRTHILRRLRDRDLLVPAGPGHYVNRIHIDDAASACLHLLDLDDPAACYIGTDGQPLETAEFYDALADYLGILPLKRHPTAPSGKRLSNQRLVESGWRPDWPNALLGYQTLIDAELK